MKNNLFLSLLLSVSVSVLTGVPLTIVGQNTAERPIRFTVSAKLSSGKLLYDHYTPKGKAWNDDHYMAKGAQGELLPSFNPSPSDFPIHLWTTASNHAGFYLGSAKAPIIITKDFALSHKGRLVFPLTGSAKMKISIYDNTGHKIHPVHFGVYSNANGQTGSELLSFDLPKSLSPSFLNHLTAKMTINRAQITGGSMLYLRGTYRDGDGKLHKAFAGMDHPFSYEMTLSTIAISTKTTRDFLGINKGYHPHFINTRNGSGQSFIASAALVARPTIRYAIINNTKKTYRDVTVSMIGKKGETLATKTFFHKSPMKPGIESEHLNEYASMRIDSLKRIPFYLHVTAKTASGEDVIILKSKEITSLALARTYAVDFRTIYAIKMSSGAVIHL